MTLALQTPALFGLVMLPFTLAIGLWVAWSDLARMKIPNAAVLTLLALFLVVGPFLLPLAEWGWRWTHALVLLAAGYVLNQIGALGAGDAKFVAAAAPFVALEDAPLLLLPLSGLLLTGLVAHRIARRIPALRALAPTWKSWTNPKFPAGFALGPALPLYLAAVVVWGR
ncbi:MAG: prepilin peptidase [Pseudomonadota bacterium]